MGLDKIIQDLQEILNTKKSRQLKRITAVKNLVSKLEKKEVKFQHKLKDAKNEKEIKKMKRHIKVCTAQLKKGKSAIEKLQKEVN